MAEPHCIPSGAERPALCLSDEDALAFAAGRLETAALLEVHLHLDHCVNCQLLLSEAARALAAAPTAPLSAADDAGWNTTFQPGARVGQRYVIRQFIARGGMGEVYEAFDEALQERVALKTVTATTCDNPRAVRRLKGEVQLARRVSHPNVCRIYDLGTHVIEQTGAQVHFLTMEFVEGETLGQRVRLGGALPVVEARKLAWQLLLGLSAAHDAGILHRDFKSDNVMLRAEAGERCTPLILDFGLARALDQDPHSATSASNPGLVGTFGYIAPEQIEGDPHTTASDVYALGVVWFEMLTGVLPFETGSSPGASALERLRRPAPPPSSVNPLVPSDLDAIVLRCLHRSPNERFRTADEVLSALEQAPRSTAKRRRLVQLAIAAGIGGLGAYWASLSEAQTSAAVAEAPHAAQPAPAVRALRPGKEPAVNDAPRSPLTTEVRPLPPTAGSSSADAARTPAPPAGKKLSQRRAPSRSPLPPEALPSAKTPGDPALAMPPAPASPAPSNSSSPAPRESKPPSGWEDPFHATGPSELRLGAVTAEIR